MGGNFVRKPLEGCRWGSGSLSLKAARGEGAERNHQLDLRGREKEWCRGAPGLPCEQRDGSWCGTGRESDGGGLLWGDVITLVLDTGSSEL